jgi:hypothetical protein
VGAPPQLDSNTADPMMPASTKWLRHMQIDVTPLRPLGSGPKSWEGKSPQPASKAFGEARWGVG